MVLAVWPGERYCLLYMGAYYFSTCNISMGELGKVQVGAEELGTATLELVEELVGDELPKTVSTTRPGGNGSSSSI